MPQNLIKPPGEAVRRSRTLAAIACVVAAVMTMTIAVVLATSPREPTCPAPLDPSFDVAGQPAGVNDAVAAVLNTRAINDVMLEPLITTMLPAIIKHLNAKMANFSKSHKAKSGGSCFGAEAWLTLSGFLMKFDPSKVGATMGTIINTAIMLTVRTGGVVVEIRNVEASARVNAICAHIGYEINLAANAWNTDLQFAVAVVIAPDNRKVMHIRGAGGVLGIVGQPQSDAHPRRRRRAGYSGRHSPHELRSTHRRLLDAVGGVDPRVVVRCASREVDGLGAVAVGRGEHAQR
ncbi:hypothetical protein T492DRAFT_843445 [Pavlovales sp. CCMP2436]|nr:hypothetical protein T492DRAFT_843445 [Pavlovales sp. CCMP2436]